MDESIVQGVIVDFATNIIPLKQNNFPTDEDIEPNSFDWFSFVARVVLQKEEAGEMEGHQHGLIMHWSSGKEDSVG